ncbi:hypothetical protein [Shewanella sp. SM74]|uniref:hypothetical protein n=1 Tax=Shewanella sp. SM74 TaxID=2912807 RepID=UPI0021DA5E10|nr:hypothetical protein [Shewanella sp. SM74]MCU8012300.1 hypothetical protein [Shewanella sp. SM74]
MLIKIINCHPSEYEENERKQLALSNLLVSYGTKRNILIAENGVFDDIVSSNLYGSIHKIYAHEANSNRREYGNLKNELAVYVNVDFTNNISKCEYINKIYVITLDYTIFSNPENTNGTSLLTENSLDYKVYNIIAEYYSKILSKRGLNIFFKEHLGAGSHSKSEFDRLSQEKKILLCLIDNDKPHPNKGEGSTSVKFTQFDKSYNINSLATVLSAREIENIIPTKTLESTVLTFSKDCIEKIDQITKFNKKNNQFRRFFDHKNGLTLKEAITLDNTYGRFWLDILSIDKRFSKKECFQSRQCTECDSCPKIDGLGDNILKNLVNKSQNESIRDFIPSIDDFLLDDWNQLGHLLVSWGCCASGKVSRAS